MTEPKCYVNQKTRIPATEGFISQIRLRLRSQDEIVAMAHSILAEDQFLDFRIEVLINFLTFENVKPLLNEDSIKAYEAGEKQWNYVSTIEECTQDFLDYMNFAWGKAEDQRGISASRSVQKLGMYLWVMNRPDLQELIESDDLYQPYGAPALIAVCNAMGIDVPKSLLAFVDDYGRC